MKDKITDSLKPPLMQRPSMVGYCKLNEMPGSGECLRQEHQFVNFWGKAIRAKSKWERRVSNRWNHIRKRELNAYICVQGEVAGGVEKSVIR